MTQSSHRLNRMRRSPANSTRGWRGTTSKRTVGYGVPRWGQESRVALDPDGQRGSSPGARSPRAPRNIANSRTIRRQRSARRPQPEHATGRPASVKRLERERIDRARRRPRGGAEPGGRQRGWQDGHRSCGAAGLCPAIMDRAGWCKVCKMRCWLQTHGLARASATARSIRLCPSAPSSSLPSPS